MLCRVYYWVSTIKKKVSKSGGGVKQVRNLQYQ